MHVVHLAIEQKRDISVELFLELKKLEVRILPGTRLEHDQEHFVAPGVVREKINHIGTLEAVRTRFFRGWHGSASILLAPINRKLEACATVQKFRVCLFGAAFCLTTGWPAAFAQFSPAFIQNSSYWNDGKAEFDIYDAQIVRYGQPRQTEVLHILVREPFDLKQMVKPDNWQRPGVIQVLKMNQVLHIPTGLYVYQQMHSNFWRADNARLAKFSLTSNDSCGNTYKEGRRGGETFAYQWHTYWDGMAEGQERITLPPNGFFYDELPLRVRTIDFSKASGDFEIQLAPSIINSKKEDLVWKSARVHYESSERAIYVTVQHDAGSDRFMLDREFPYLLRRWDAADGSRLQLKRSLKVDYWNYHGLGDRKRALLNRMLEHPD
jgi:hypothetical protein